MTITSVAVLMFLVMDPLGNIAFFIAALSNVDPKRQRIVIVRELLVALAVMIVFLFAGRSFLQLLGISADALTIAGGVILLLIALRMIFPHVEKPLREDVMGEPFIVPLAIPYVAGPSAMATELLLMNKEPNRWPEWLFAIVLAWFASSLILYFASGLRRYVTDRGLIAVERLMGMVLVTVAVQMLLTGTSQFLQAHR
jgi:multiple antibiotic resistance protein